MEWDLQRLFGLLCTSVGRLRPLKSWQKRYCIPEVLTAVVLCPLKSWQLWYRVPWSPDSCGIVSPEFLTAVVLCPLKSWQVWYCVPWSPSSCGIVSPKVLTAVVLCPPEVMTAVVLCPPEVLTAMVLCLLKFWQLWYCVPWSSDSCGIVSPESPHSCGIVSPEVLTAVVLCPLKFWQLWYCVPWSSDSCGIVSPEVLTALVLRPPEVLKALHDGWCVRNIGMSGMRILAPSPCRTVCHQFTSCCSYPPLFFYCRICSIRNMASRQLQYMLYQIRRPLGLAFVIYFWWLGELLLLYI